MHAIMLLTLSFSPFLSRMVSGSASVRILRLIEEEVVHLNLVKRFLTEICAEVSS